MPVERHTPLVAQQQPRNSGRPPTHDPTRTLPHAPSFSSPQVTPNPSDKPGFDAPQASPSVQSANRNTFPYFLIGMQERTTRSVTSVSAEPPLKSNKERGQGNRPPYDRFGSRLVYIFLCSFMSFLRVSFLRHVAVNYRVDGDAAMLNKRKDRCCHLLIRHIVPANRSSMPCNRRKPAKQEIIFIVPSQYSRVLRCRIAERHCMELESPLTRTTPPYPETHTSKSHWSSASSCACNLSLSLCSLSAFHGR